MTIPPWLPGQVMLHEPLICLGLVKAFCTMPVQDGSMVPRLQAGPMICGCGLVQ